MAIHWVVISFVYNRVGLEAAFRKRRGVGVFSGRRRAADQSASGVSEQRPDNRRNPFVHAKNKDHPLGWSLALAYVFEWICEHYWKAAANHAIHKNVVKLDTL